ncbi:hypothetical protein [Suipraeoptans intestinalis]|uniref:hypothetical protein n=1 Tax=Suipraeoptans intestinalis TaxID=2606628 RepID=UPI0023F49B56|nr:hypothetical protein [Suipraeoptans intestinalis]MDD7769518.1 hypothetical protein [Suipraeoptans intestinalis]MDY3121801.1 hypothetical protein [Suipraeoptans intestinalis]
MGEERMGKGTREEKTRRKNEKNKREEKTRKKQERKTRRKTAGRRRFFAPGTEGYAIIRSKRKRLLWFTKAANGAGKRRKNGSVRIYGRKRKTGSGAAGSTASSGFSGRGGGAAAYHREG